MRYLGQVFHGVLVVTLVAGGWGFWCIRSTPDVAVWIVGCVIWMVVTMIYLALVGKAGLA